MGDYGVVLKYEPASLALSLPTNVRSKPNTTVTVPITVGNATGIANGSITVAYDPKFLKATGAKPTSLTNGFTVTPNTATAGQITITFSRAAPIPSGNGELFKLEFTVSSNLAVGSSTPLTFQSASIQGFSQVQLASGTLTIIGTTGDLNNDGVVDVGDSIFALRLVQNLSTLNPIYEKSVGDLNQDGQVNDADAVILLRQDVGLK